MPDHADFRPRLGRAHIQCKLIVSIRLLLVWTFIRDGQREQKRPIMDAGVGVVDLPSLAILRLSGVAK